MDNANNNKQPNTFSSKIGLISGALLIGLGLWIVFTKPEANQYIAYFMIVYGAFRLGLAAYSNFLRKKQNPNDDGFQAEDSFQLDNKKADETDIDKSIL